MNRYSINRPKNPYLRNDNLTEKWHFRWGMIIFWLFIICGGIYFFRYSPFFKIRDVLIEGTRAVNQDEVRGIADDYMNREDNLFKFPIQAVESSLYDKFVLIDKVNVTRGIPSTIKIELTEREGFLIWRTYGKNYLVDKKGIAFRETDETFSLPVVYDEKNEPVNIGDKILIKSFVKFITDLNKNFKSKTKLEIKKMIVRESSFELDVVTSRFLIKFDTLRDANGQIDDLVKVLPHIKGKVKKYIDLRIENWAYYK